MNAKNSGSFKQRLIASTAGLIVMLVLIAFSQEHYFKPIFSLAISTIISFGLWEFYQLAKAKGYSPLTWVGVVGTIAYGFAMLLRSEAQQYAYYPEAVLILILFISLCSFLYRGEQPYLNISATLGGIIYITIPLSFIISITYQFPAYDGRWWLFYLLFVTKMTDIGAYFVGKWIGAHRMAPYISPQKTWEGAVGGFVLGTLSSVAMAIFITAFAPNYLSLHQSLWLGAIISIMAQIGDLAESLLKRDAGIKDSNQLPGLGGILDIVDSLIFTTPIVYFFLVVLK